MISGVQSALFVVLLLIAAFVDMKKREIPNEICLAIALLSLFDLHLYGVLMAIPFLVCAYTKKYPLGGGDVKFIAMVGLFLGFWSTLYGLIIGLSLVVMLWICKPGQGEKSIPLAPFLTMGFLMAYFIF